MAFTSGVATGTMTLFKAESPNVTVTDGTYSTSSPLAMTVNPGPLDHFTWTQEPGASQTAGITFPETIEVKAFDAYGNLKTNYDPTTTPAVFSGSTSRRAAVTQTTARSTRLERSAATRSTASLVVRRCNQHNGQGLQGTGDQPDRRRRLDQRQ